MPVDFPTSPVTNQTYTYSGKTWTWNGSAWQLTNSTVTGTVGITSGGTGQTTANAGFNALAPSQTGNSGKYLTTNGTDTSWGTVIPSGSLQMFAGSITQSASVGVVTTTAPSGWLLANGDLVSRATYSALFSAIGTVYGAGDGSTTFALPDMRGRTGIGAGTGAGLTARTLGGTVGTETHTLAIGNIPQMTTDYMSTNANHTHGPGSGQYFWVYNSSGANTVASGTAFKISADASTAATSSTNINHTHTVGTASPTAISNLQPSIGLNFIIKT